MAHLSDFWQHRQAETERLLSELVSATLRAEPGDDVHEAGLEWSLASVVWHQFPDVNPSFVDAQYGGLGSRLGAHAQFSKRAMLGRLVEAFHRQELQKSTLEVHHSILSAILCLAGKPLQHSYQPSAAAMACLQSVSPGECLDNASSELSALSHWGDPDSGAASSDLSDWGEDTPEPALSEGGSLEDLKVAQVGAAAPGKHSVVAKWLQLGQLDTAPKPEKLPVNRNEVPELRDDCLLRRVLEVRAQGTGLSLPPPELCLMESDLVHQILHMLRGCPCPGNAIRLSAAPDAFTVAPGVHVAHLSPACLSRVLHHWVRWGTTAFRLQIFSGAIRKAATSSGDGSGNSPIRLSTTLAAYATAFAAELDLVEHALIGVQDTFAAHSRDGPGDVSAVNLATLEFACQGIVRRIGMLECVAGSISIAAPRLRTAAQQSVSALDGLHRLLLAASENSTPRGREFAAVLRRLLLAALKPCVDRLQLWVEEGCMDDPFDEMLICAGSRGTSTRSPDFWQDAFRLRTDDHGTLLCPELFRSVAEDILEAGKAALLLHTEHRCSNGTCLPPAASGGPSLHAEVQLRLQRQVLPQPSAQRGLYIFSTHVCMAICVSPFAALRHAQKGASRMPASERPALHVCKVHADGSCGTAPVQGTIADRMAALAAGPFDQYLTSLALPESSAACGTGISSCNIDNIPLYDLPQADKIMAHSLAAESLHQPRSSSWQLSRYLSMSSPRNRAAALHGATKQSSSFSSSPGRQQGIHEIQTLSSQQENLPTGSPCRHPRQAQTRKSNPAQDHSKGILGDVSNIIPTREQAEKTVLKQASSAVLLQAAPAEAETTQVGDSKPSPEQEASATHAVDSGADSSDQQHGLGHADGLLSDWYHRTMAGICSTSSLRAATDEPETMMQRDASCSHRLHSVLVAAHTGAAVQQMWSAQWRAFAEEAAEAGSLDALGNADLAPAQALLESCILAPLLERADRSRQALMRQVTGAWAMQQHLDALWRTLFLASPAMQPFLSTTHDMLAASHRDDTELRAVDLQRALDMTLSDAELGSMLPSSSVSVRLEEPASERAGRSRISSLRLDIKVPWPLTLVVQNTHLQQYNAIFAVLLQVHVACKALNEVYSSACPDSTRRGRGLDRASALAMSMRHFLGTYLAHVMGHLAHSCACGLHQATASASTLEEIIAAHQQFLTDAANMAFTSPQQSSKLLHHAHCRLLSLVWKFVMIASPATTRKAAGAPAKPDPGELSSLWEAWHDRRRYFERLLNGCAVRASPCSGLKELAASISLSNCERS